MANGATSTKIGFQFFPGTASGSGILLAWWSVRIALFIYLFQGGGTSVISLAHTPSCPCDSVLIVAVLSPLPSVTGGVIMYRALSSLLLRGDVQSVKKLGDLW